jgi:hypothetical protein
MRNDDVSLSLENQPVWRGFHHSHDTGHTAASRTGNGFSHRHILVESRHTGRKA